MMRSKSGYAKMKTRLLAVATLVSVLSLSPAFAQEPGGFGKNIPLELAVRQIVPEGTTVQLADGVDAKVRVSWDGASGWRKSLEQAVAGAGYVMAVADNKITISRAGAVIEQVASVEAKPASGAAPKPAAPAKPSKPKKKPGPAAQPKPVVEMPVVSGGGFVLIPETVQTAKADGGWTEYDQQAETVRVPEWVVKPGDDLNATLSAWAEKEGWRLVWESEYIYELTSAAKFRGDFVTATTELLRSMQDARPVITAQFYQGNKVLVVGNGNLDEVN